MSSGSYGDVYLGEAVAVAIGATAIAGAAIAVGAVHGTIALGENLGEGTIEVLHTMQKENQERLKLEQEDMLRLKKEQEMAYSSMNIYIDKLLQLRGSDQKLASLGNTEGAAQAMASLVNKREACRAQIQQLRDKAIQSRNIDEIDAYSNQALQLFEGLEGQLGPELLFFGSLGVDLPEYGSSTQDALAMIRTGKHEVSEIRLRSIEEGETVTEQMLQQDYSAFTESLSRAMCNGNLNDRQINDLMAVKVDMDEIARNQSLPPARKKMRLAELYKTFQGRKNAIATELEEMEEEYEKYLQLTFDVPDERLELYEFDSVDEVAGAVKQAREAREKREQKRYVELQIERIMKKHDMNLVDSQVLGRAEDDERVLYRIDDSTAVDVYVSDDAHVSTRVVGVNFGQKTGEADEEALVQRTHTACHKLAEIQEELEDVGIRVGTINTLPPDRKYNTWIQLDTGAPAAVKKKARRERNRRQPQLKVMQMTMG